MMGREITYTDLDDETSYTMRQDKCKTLSGVQMSRFMNSLHRVFGQSLGILPSNLVTSTHAPGTFPSPRGFNFDYSANTLHEVQQRLRSLQPFSNDIGYFPTADFQYSQCQENIPEFYLTSPSRVERTSTLESMMEETLRRTPPAISSSSIIPSGQQLVSPNLQYPTPLAGMYTFFVPVYPCYVLIPAVQQTQTNMRN